ncbi:AraC family transcriptional regulator ligand-binding domain-containing protein [Lutimaribacter marinistellae]|uniref:AraC family transcriptional regulator ligand-binding domain-containing protein n=1 Tax=Lutimaribacter marinistellae TaxID=1820329 RepID=A0ABV7TK09_9RHOB
MTALIPAQTVANLLEGAARHGFAADDLLARAGLAVPVTDLDTADFVRLVRVVTLALDDELAGLQHRRQRIGTHAIMAAHVAMAGTLGAAWQRLAQFSDLMDNSFHFTLRDMGDETVFEMTRIPRREVLNHTAVDMVLVLVGHMMIWLGGNRRSYSAAWFDFPPPVHAPAYRRMFGRVPLQFGAPTSGLAFASSQLKLPVHRTEAEAIAYARRTPLDAFLPVDAVSGLALDTSLAVETALAAEGRLPTMAEVAATLGFAQHTLRRRLRREGVGYPDIRTQVRREMAVRLLTTTGDSVEQIAARLGFSEASAFVRAFRGWTGLTPGAYRNSEF